MVWRTRLGARDHSSLHDHNHFKCAAGCAKAAASTQSPMSKLLHMQHTRLDDFVSKHKFVMLVLAQATGMLCCSLTLQVSVSRLWNDSILQQKHAVATFPHVYVALGQRCFRHDHSMVLVGSGTGLGSLKADQADALPNTLGWPGLPIGAGEHLAHAPPDKDVQMYSLFPLSTVTSVAVEVFIRTFGFTFLLSGLCRWSVKPIYHHGPSSHNMPYGEDLLVLVPGSH